MGPWATLGLGAVCVGAAFVGVRMVKLAYDRDPRVLRGLSPRPAWWRIRAIGWYEMTVVPVIVAIGLWGLAMPFFSLLLWTDFVGFGIAGLVVAGAGMCSVLWWLYDSLGPHAWRQGSDEYRL